MESGEKLANERAEEAKELGNKHFAKQEYISAADCYTKAMQLCHNKKTVAASVYYKNRAACYLKLHRYEEVIEDCESCLAVVPDDTKALFRYCQGLQKLSRWKEAYQEARKLNQLNPNNKAVLEMLRELTKEMNSKSQAYGTTSSLTQQMYATLLDTLSSDEQRRKALNNLCIVAKDKAGAEYIFRHDATWKLLPMLDNADVEVQATIMKLFTHISKGYRNRMSAILKEITGSRLLKMLSSPMEDLCQSVAYFLKTALTTMTGCDDSESNVLNEAVVVDNKHDIEIILDLLVNAMTNESIGISGRSAAVHVIVHAIPESGMAKTFMECKGLNKLLKVAADSAQCLMISSEESNTYNENITTSCQMYVSVALFHLYGSLKSNTNLLIFRRQCEIFIREQIQYSSNIDMNIGGAVALSAILVGVSDVGVEIGCIESIQEKLLEMIATNNLASKCAAVEVLTHICSNKEKCLQIRSQIYPLFKVLYAMKNDKIRIRALVGLCKIGLVNATDVKEWLPEESVFEIFMIVRRYLVEEGKGSADLSKWSSEALAFITMDADAKEILVEDDKALKALFSLAKSEDMTVAFGIASTLVNITNSYDKPERNPELEKLAQFAQYKIPKTHEKDGEEYVKERISTLIKENVVVALVNLGVEEKSDSCKEKLTRVFLALSNDPKHRGIIVQQGGTKVLCSLALNGTNVGKSFAAQALAKIGITMNPELAFPGQRMIEIVRPLIGLLASESGLQQFEALMALTNLAQMNDSVRRRIMKEKGFSKIEQLMFDDHELIKRAATEAMCNLVYCEEAAEKFGSDKIERVKILTLYSGEADFELARAASGALAILSANENICEKILQVKAWLEIMQELLLSDKVELQQRGMHIVANMIEANEAIATKVIRSNLLEIMMVLSRETDPTKKGVMASAERGLQAAVKLGLIKPNS